MTDINRLIASLKRRSAHVKEFGDDITFVKLEDLDALVEVVELARTKAAEWEEKAAINYAERTAMIQHIGELESRTVTVKLPQAVSAGGQGYQEQVERILTAAGIKWEAE
ncbi:hypothetical protein [Klebsiella michiganensis]|uniref:hypothetical protein n=1 Tax=Klebsiella michiganensis TaxID=1134687 RepID=UPI0012AB42C1|nr:hypothetical protein [Klebsiella michiganensis]